MIRGYRISSVAIVACLISLALGLQDPTTTRTPPFVCSTDFGSADNEHSKFTAWEPKEKNKVDKFADNHETYTGHITVRSKNPGNKLFYVLHSAKNAKITDKLPLIVYFQGGPGCSSLYGDMLEIGPVSIEDFDEKSGASRYSPRQNTWAIGNHLLFIDQPIGTGYSTREDGPIRSTTQAAKDVHQFFIRFFEVWPELLQDEIYLFGEDFAGHFVPAIAHEVIRNAGQNKMKLKGLGIGGAWIDPINQIGFYDYIAYSAGLVAPVGRDFLTTTQNEAILDIMNMNLGKATQRFNDSIGYIQDNSPGVDISNFRRYNHDKPREAFYPAWAKHASTLKLFNAPDNLQFVSCNKDIYNNYTDDFSESFAWALGQVVGKIKVLIYQGQNDLVVNAAGTNNWITNFNFPKSDDIRDQPKKIWKIGDTVAGTVQLKGGFYYAVINGAGHYAPQDQPVESHDMLTHFLNGDKEWISKKKNEKIDL